MKDKTRIGIKYCGGCNPEYDRVKTAKMIANQLKDVAELVDYRNSDVDSYLLITGCKTACVDTAQLRDLPIVKVCNLAEVEQFIEQTRKSTLMLQKTASSNAKECVK